MLEELSIFLFAQEAGTAHSVSMDVTNPGDIIQARYLFD
jgi:hypothetical protein